MSGQPVDVLAVLDYEIRTIPICTEDYGPQRAQDVRDLSEARAAVAELVAADLAFDEAVAAHGISSRWAVEANERRAAALAPFQAGGAE